MKVGVRLPVRLFVWHAVVAAVGVVVAYLTVWLLAPRLADRRMTMMNGMGMGPMHGTTASVHAVFLSALDTALVVGLAASLVAAGAVAVVVTRRLLRPLDAVRHATRRIAAGR